MQHVLSFDGKAALAALLHEGAGPGPGTGPLLAFDFDGTLAPIVPHPDDARVPPALAGCLRQLAARLPVAIVSGRAVADLRGRLGFTPQAVIGNHGAETGRDRAAEARLHAALDPLRATLQVQAAALRAAGVLVEDKGLSIALHDRQAADPAQAGALVDALLAPHAGALRRFGGKRVVNLVAAGAPDKADALLQLVARLGVTAALYAGDDVNDEPVFARAPAHWLTLRIGRDDPASRARFVLDRQSELLSLLQRLLTMLHLLASAR
jgi:trehalose 6-phosphate phosphatase